MTILSRMKILNQKDISGAFRDDGGVWFYGRVAFCGVMYGMAGRVRSCAVMFCEVRYGRFGTVMYCEVD